MLYGFELRSPLTLSHIFINHNTLFLYGFEHDISRNAYHFSEVSNTINIFLLNII